jgi:hypothetical protein
MTQDEIIQTLIGAMGTRMFNASQREAFEQALNLLEQSGKALPFVRDCRRFRDYHRRTKQMLSFLQTADLNPTVTLPKRHVGRPTKQEQAEYFAAQKQKALAETKASLFPDAKPDLSVRPLTYGGIIANPNGESIAATMPHLQQVRPFLSEALQERVNSVRDLRAEMASKAEQAKTMTEANERSAGTLYTEAEIAELATRAVEIESDILPAIYNDVDREMGECYLRLSQKKGDPEYIAWVEKTFNIAPQDLRTQFKPFYEKALARDPRFEQMVNEKIAADRPEVKAARDKAAKHKAEADAMVKYIIRKDKPSTKARLKGLEERIEKLRRDYSDIVDAEELTGYEAIRDKVKAEVEQ